MQNLFDMKREELTEFLKQLSSKLEAKNKLELALENNVYIREAQEKLAQGFCDKYDESMANFLGMQKGDKNSFLRSSFATTFKQAPSSETYKLLAKKAKLLDQLRAKLTQQQGDFRLGGQYGAFGAGALLLLGALLFGIAVTPPFKIIGMLLFIGGLYIAYCVYKFKGYERKIEKTVNERDALAVEMDKESLPYLQKMFKSALDEWQNDPHNVAIMNDAEAKTDQAREQLAAIDLTEMAMIPAKFRNLTFLKLFKNYLQEGRADSWKECVNLYHQEVQFDENVRHHREQEEHNRQQNELQQQELWEQRQQSGLQEQQLQEQRQQSGLQEQQLQEQRLQSGLQQQQLGEMAKQSKMQSDQLKEARRQTANQDKQLNELKKHTRLGKVIGASSILQNVQLNSIHAEQKDHDRWVEKGFRTKEEEEQYRLAHPKWSRNHPRHGYYR